MNLENQAKESPLEKAKRLKAEKETKDLTKKETESQAKTEKLDALNNSKQDLENKLDEINAQIEASRSEAHETRDTMKEADLDKDEDFKEEYNSTISEVAGNLSELRNERNKIKAELEQINSDIENFGVNEIITEGKEATQDAVENVNEENEEAVAQVESYPGADAQDVEEAKEVVDETSKEVNQVVENSEKDISEVTSENKTESDLETVKLNSKYSEILDKEKLINEKISELGKQDDALRTERRTLEGTGNDKRLEEIKNELEKNEQEGKKLQWGEKVYTLVQQRNEINNKKSLIDKEKYDYYKERSKYDDKEKRLKDLEEEGEKIHEMLTSVSDDENGLDGLHREEGKLRMEFNKKYGYDKDFANEAYGNLHGLGRRDADRIAINNCLGLELPIFSKEFKLKDIGEGRMGNKFDFIQDNSSDGQYNKNLLAKKQLALWEKVKGAREMLSKLSKEDKSKLIRENQLIFDALKNVSGSQNQPLEDNISDVFMPMAGVGKAMYLDSVEDKNLFPEKGIKVGDEILTPYGFEEMMYSDSNYTMNALILQKLAKENGLISE